MGILGKNDWPSYEAETFAWEQKYRGGIFEDRIMREVRASIPPLIQDLDFYPPLKLQLVTDESLLVVARADMNAFERPVDIGSFMIHAEARASSKIEGITAPATEVVKALKEMSAHRHAMSTAAGLKAMSDLVRSVSKRGYFRLEDILNAHRTLMDDEPDESLSSGALRDVQNWIGRSNHSPRDALYVPPTPARVAELMDDLVKYLNRDDVPVMVQAAIGHAQFESIHPFVDGNGRVGRALIAAVLCRRRVTNNTVIPLSFGLLARRCDYYEALEEYRAGNPVPVIELLARSIWASSIESRETIARLQAVPAEWAAEIKPRDGSAAANLIPAFCQQVVMNSGDALQVSGSGAPQTYKALLTLTDAGFLQEVTGRQKNRVWAVSEILAETGDLESRIHQRMTGIPPR